MATRENLDLKDQKVPLELVVPLENEENLVPKDLLVILELLDLKVNLVKRETLDNEEPKVTLDNLDHKDPLE